MFLCCRKCQWTQDDFWDEYYNPVEMVQDCERQLFECDFDAEVGGLSKRETIARMLMKAAVNVLQMKYRTIDEFKERNPEGLCPDCGAELSQS